MSDDGLHEDYEQAQLEKSLGGLIPEDLREPDDSARRASAIEGRARFDAFVRGANARAELLDENDISALGHGVTHLMLSHIITGRLKPKTAKEAVDVAKVAQDIARKADGSADVGIMIRTPEERQRAIAQIAELRAIAAARVLEAGQATSLDGPDVIDVEVVEPDIVAGTAAGSIPPSSPTGRHLVTIPAVTSEP